MSHDTKIRRQTIIPSKHRATSVLAAHKRKGPHLLTGLFSVLVFIAFIHFGVTIHAAAYPTIQPKTCTDLIHYSDYTKYVHLRTTTQEMEAVQFVPQLMGGMPSALVQVMGNDAQHTLDLYIYGCTMHQQIPTMTLLFQKQSLPQGMASVSLTNTLITDELDTSLSNELLATVEPTQQSIYHEYVWQNGSFVQVEFPGLYPVNSRGAAEALQGEANNGQTFPWNDPLATAEQMAKDIFQWSDSNPQDAVQDNDGKTAHVVLFHTQLRMQVTLTLARLIQPNATGLWFVTGAQTAGITITQSTLPLPVTSPISIQGTLTATDGTITVYVFDHLLNPLPIVNTPDFSINGDGLYSGNILFNNETPNQPGLLLIEEVPPSNSTEAGQLLLTHVLLG